MLTKQYEWFEDMTIYKNQMIMVTTVMMILKIFNKERV